MSGYLIQQEIRYCVRKYERNGHAGGGSLSYLSLYRKYRPQRFADVVGQEAIVRTLQNALERGRVSHAYMFSGPRGTGKTTLARLLAKGLNCQKGPAVEPCNSCPNCQRINDGSAMDVIEIDGASNRGIDEIRDLRENVRFAPTEGGHKVYIIDEVHMLTTDAFNALLKTLEEPPDHVVFVLATTESHKVPETIASRCQRFEFRNFTPEQLMLRLQQVVEAEGLDVAPAALRLIGRHAAGGMRDALALLDQAVSFQTGRLEESHVAELLGVVPEDAIWHLIDCLARGQRQTAITDLHQLVDKGADPAQLAKDCISFLRELMLDRAGYTGLALSTDEGKWPGLASLELEEILHFIEELARATADMRWMSPTWLPLEMAIIRSTAKESSSELAAVGYDWENSSRWQQLSRRLDGLEAGLRALQGANESQMPSMNDTTEPMGIEPEAKEDSRHSRPSMYSPASQQPGDFQPILGRWDEVAEMLRQERQAPVEAFLREATPVGLNEAGSLILAFPKDRGFHKVSLEHPKNREVLEKVLARLMGRAMGVVCCFEEEASNYVSADSSPAHEAEISETDPSTVSSISGTKNREPGGKAPEPTGSTVEEGTVAEQSVEDTGNPALNAAIRLFGGKVREVENRSGEGFEQ